MEKIYSKVQPDVLLHIVNRMSDIIKVREDVVPTTEFLQMAAMNLPINKTFVPHKHIIHEKVTNIAQESWVVIKGSVKCIFYDLDDTIIAEPILMPGDCSITLRGGHNYLSLEENTLVYEYKTGPYLGQELDKTFIK
jgi:hypothetical protein